MTLYISGTHRKVFKAGVRYLIASIIVAAAGAIYELFSHGVYSYYMIYAFMLPLTCGALPCLLAVGPGRDGESSDSGTTRSLMFQLASVITLTAGSIIKGVLEIYGTTNRLTVTYPVLGLVLAAAALVSVFCNIVRKHRSGAK